MVNKIPMSILKYLLKFKKTISENKSKVYLSIVLLSYVVISLFWVIHADKFHNPFFHILFILISFLFLVVIIFVISIKNKKEEFTYKNNADLIIKEMNHRIKNNIGILTNIIDLKKYIYTDSNSQKLLDDLRNKTFLISHIHEKIYTSVDITKIKLAEYIKEIIDTTNNFYDAKIEVVYDIDDIAVMPKHAVNFALLVQEIFTNSVKYAYNQIEDKKFSICIKDNYNYYNLNIFDNGCGFDSIKLDKSESFGMEMLKTIVEQYSGEMKFINNNGMHVNIKFTK